MFEKRINNENRNPKSLGRIGYNTAFKNRFQLKNNISSKNNKFLARTPLKSKINLINTNQKEIDDKGSKEIRYPLLKSLSSFNINNNIISDDLEEDEPYNEDALEDQMEDFGYDMKEKEIYINNDEEEKEEKNKSSASPKIKVHIMNYLNDMNPFGGFQNINYNLPGHFEDDAKKTYDDYFNSPDDDNDLVDIDD